MFKYLQWISKLCILCVLIIISTIIVCCSQKTTSISRKQTKSYTLEEEHKVNVGNAKLFNELGHYVTGRKYVGSGGYGEDNWVEYEEPTGDTFREELIYTGRSGTTLFVSYREYRRDMARPSFFQDLRYDIESNDIIVFRNYRIKILEATSEAVRFIILED